MIEVQKGVPMPADRNGNTRKGKYPWKQMEVGDSFFVPNKSTSAFGANIVVAKRSTGFNFVSRNENDGVRVWRVE
jgi:hypothetical protein